MTDEIAEEWRPTHCLPHSYEVSNLGRVRSVDRVIRRPGPKGVPVAVRYRGNVLTLGRLKRGEVVAQMHDGDAKVSMYVSRLVAFAFIGPETPGKEVAHNDGNPANNVWTNLRWATHAENMDDMVRHGTRIVGEGIDGAFLSPESVVSIKIAAMMGVTFREIGYQFKISRATVSDIVLGVTWKHVAVLGMPYGDIGHDGRSRRGRGEWSRYAHGLTG